jgi:hypothetical protein
MAFLTAEDIFPAFFTIQVHPTHQYVSQGQSVYITAQADQFINDVRERFDFADVVNDTPRVTVFNPSETIIVDLATMPSAGGTVYEYLFDTTGLPSGVYSAIFKAIHTVSIVGQVVKHGIVSRRVFVCRVI